MAQKRTDIEAHDLLNLYQTGLTTYEVADKFGVSQGFVCARLREFGVSGRSRRVLADSVQIVAMYEGGASEKAVADHFGIARSAIRLRLIEAGVTPRSQSEAEALKWSNMNASARKRQVASANAAARGREHSLAEKCKRAQTVERKRLHISGYEIRLAALLAARGVVTTPQQAIGPYNCDLGAFPVAVEVFGGNWHWSGRHNARTPERFRHILNAGWHILAVRLSSAQDRLTGATADHVVAFIEQVRGDPSARRQYRVIGSAGDLIAAGSSDDDEISIIPAFTSGRNAIGQYERVSR